MTGEELKREVETSIALMGPPGDGRSGWIWADDWEQIRETLKACYEYIERKDIRDA